MHFLSWLVVVVAANVANVASATFSSTSETSTTSTTAANVGKTLPGSFQPTALSTGSEFNTPDVTQESNTKSPIGSTAASSSMSRVFYSTITKSNGMNIVLVNTVVLVTSTVTGGTGSASTQKYDSTTEVTSTFYILPTTITRSHKYTKTVTATRSVHSKPCSSTASSAFTPIHPITTSFSSAAQTTYCLNADANTKAPCSTTTTSSVNSMSSSITSTNSSTTAASSHMVNLSGAPSVLKTAQYSSVVATLATLFCIERLDPVSLAFVVTDAFAQQGLGSLVFVTASLLLYLVGRFETQL